MQKSKKYIAATSVAVLIAATAMSGCGSKSYTNETDSNFKFSSYPMQTDVTLSYWVGLNPNTASVAENLGKTRYGEELQKQTGVSINFIHPPIGQESEQFNIILSSGNLPDIVEADWLNFTGGPKKAVDEKLIINLNDVIDDYAPNLKKYLSERPEIDKSVKANNDDGTFYYVFPFIREDPLLKTNQGLVLRKDWLDELGLEIPETIDEWHNVLTLFKEKKGSLAPLSFAYGTDIPPVLVNGIFTGAYGITADWFVEDGKVIYGPADERYKKFLTLFSQWYKEGLIDPNIASVDQTMLDTKIINNTTGASYGWGGSWLGKWIPALKQQNPGYDLIAAPSPVMNKGDKPEFGQLDQSYPGGFSAAITTSCKNVEIAARFLDYNYSEAGHILQNFGIEGESYNMVNGYPTYTDIIMNNPDGLSIGSAMGIYIRGNQGGPFVQAKEYVEQYYTLSEQKNALKVWSDTNMSSHKLPTMSIPADENSELSNIMNNVKTYVSEKTVKFIMGTESLDNFDTYLKKINSFNLDRAVEIYQNAYDLYNKN